MEETQFNWDSKNKVYYWYWATSPETAVLFISRFKYKEGDQLICNFVNKDYELDPECVGEFFREEYDRKCSVLDMLQKWALMGRKFGFLRMVVSLFDSDESMLNFNEQLKESLGDKKLLRYVPGYTNNLSEFNTIVISGVEISFRAIINNDHPIIS